jgi:catechol 2,3-dioxygenase-like lactoylglutathione lyase family enzyme
MKITGSNVTVMVADMDRSISFYESIGLKTIQRWENYYAMMGAEGITLGIHPAEEKPTGSGSLSIGFFIDSAEETRDLLNRLSIPFQENADDGGSGHYFNFKDPDGTLLYFVLPKWS